MNGPPAGCGGRRARHRPSAPAVAVTGAGPTPDTETVAPGASHPQIVAPAPPRCSTLWLPNTLDTRSCEAAAAVATRAAAASARASRAMGGKCNLKGRANPCAQCETRHDNESCAVKAI